MASKREEKAAFEKLKKVFSGEDVALECKVCTWRLYPIYYAYASGIKDGKGISTICINHLTPEEAINDLISQRKEVTKDQEPSG